MKSAREIALEKIKDIGEPTEDEKLRWQYLPLGEKLAGKYLEENIILSTELSKYKGRAKKYVLKGLEETLVDNIYILKNDAAKRRNKKAMEGIKEIKKDKVAAENVFSKMRSLFKHDLEEGEKQREQVFNNIKEKCELQLRQAAQQKYGQAAGQMEMKAEQHPKFQEEVRRVMAQIDSGYLNHLDNFKKELAIIN